MLAAFGVPRDNASNVCQPVTNPKLKAAIKTASVGPFRATGHQQALAALKAVLAEVKTAKPDLYEVLGSAGMLCARLVRGSATNWSNHSWGFAIDFEIEGILDKPGDDKVLVGLLELYPFFHRHGWYWGAEFPKEDGMHFEVADETFKKWQAEGLV